MVMCSQVSVYLQGGRHAWQGVCVAGPCMVWGVGGRRVCMTGGHVWQGCAWRGGGMCDRGVCMAGETANAAGILLECILVHTKSLA